MEGNITKFWELYDDRVPVLRAAADRLRIILEDAVAEIEDRKLARAKVHDVRVKNFESLRRKAQKNKWDVDDALSRCADLVGGRVVCSNVKDVYRFADLLKERLPSAGEVVQEQDYIKEPNKGGYRGLHLTSTLSLREGELIFSQFHEFVCCEVQIRSRLQDTWAELSHDDIYKQPGLPEDLYGRAKDLAEVLSAADSIASDIRSRVMRETVPPRDRPDLTRVSAEGIAYVFKGTFGRSPPDYVVQEALNLSDQLDITMLEKVPQVIGQSEFRDIVTKTYRLIRGLELAVEDIFLAALYAVAKDEDEAVQWVARKARQERREFERIARHEALNSLPDTIEELIEQLNDPYSGVNVEAWAWAFGASNGCAICDTPVIQPDSFAEAAVRHYKLSESEEGDAVEQIESALLQSAVETGEWLGEGSLCAYHAAQDAKDD